MNIFNGMIDLFKKLESCESQNKKFMNYFNGYLYHNAFNRREDAKTEYIFESRYCASEECTGMFAYAIYYYNSTPELLNAWSKRQSCGGDDTIITMIGGNKYIKLKLARRINP